MCGGRGTRLDSDVEKPLVTVDGAAMVDRVIAALDASAVETVHAVVSPNAPATRERLADRVSTVETPGEGYVADLSCALDRGDVERPALTVAADLPLLDGSTVDAVIAAHGLGSLTVCVPVALKRALGVSVDATLVPGLAPAGINVVGAKGDRIETFANVRLAVNVNRPRDREVAEALAVGDR